MRTVALLFGCVVLSLAQSQTTFEERPAYRLANGKLELLVLPEGSTLASVVLTADPQKLNPLWDPNRFARETGKPAPRGSGMGHFLCVDGFGPVSPEEQKAGLRGHGEAVQQHFDVKPDGDLGLMLTTTLPLLQERLTRTVKMAPGENVVYVHTRLESLLAFDRPLSWGEHATIGSPFLERGVTVFDLPAVKSKTRPHEKSDGPVAHRFVSDKEFAWPMVPLEDGTAVDVRAAPVSGATGDHTTHLLDRSKPYGWVTALHPGRKLIVGWIFKTADFPWVQNWESFPASNKLARGLEFSTQPFDVPRRDAVAMNGLFGAPTFRWMPAKTAIETDLALFYAPVPDGFSHVKDVRAEGGSIVVEDVGGKVLKLAASNIF